MSIINKDDKTYDYNEDGKSIDSISNFSSITYSDGDESYVSAIDDRPQVP